MIVAADQFIEVLFKNNMEGYCASETVDQCNEAVIIFVSTRTPNDAATTRATTKLTDHATTQAMTRADQKEKMNRITAIHVKVANGRTITISCHTKRTIEEIKKQSKKRKSRPYNNVLQHKAKLFTYHPHMHHVSLTSSPISFVAVFFPCPSGHVWCPTVCCVSA